jgi:hypothetical protein
MNADDYVDACRREWERLRVPAEIAEEMAAELRSDLAEAEADGVPAEELLGEGTFDAPGLAASWASERGVVPARSRRRIGLLAGVAVAVAAIGLAAGLLSMRSTTPKQTSLTQAVPTLVIRPGSRVVGTVGGTPLQKLVIQLSQLQQRTFTYGRP